MDKLCGKKVDRSRLFDNDGDGSDHDEQDFAAFEKMMESRLKVEQPDQAPPPVESKAQDTASEDGKGDAKSSGGDIPMFRLFAGAGPVKVKSLSSEVEYIQPKRPEVAMEESDSEDHWSALAAAAIDAQTIRAVAQIPLPAMLYPKRVIHIPVDKKQSSGADQVPATRGRRRRRRHHKLASGKLESKAGSVRYVRVLSPYTGGTVKGKMLADVVREEEEAASAALRRANSTRGGRGGGRGGAGFSGRGRGRGRGRGGR